MKIERILTALGLLAMLSLQACGSSSDDDDEVVETCKPSGIFFSLPVADCETFATNGATVELSGFTFISPPGVDCVTVMPQSIEITWRNVATGQIGIGGNFAFCQPIPFTVQKIPRSLWSIMAGQIHLQLGENRVEVTGKDVLGRVETQYIVVERI